MKWNMKRAIKIISIIIIYRLHYSYSEESHMQESEIGNHDAGLKSESNNATTTELPSDDISESRGVNDSEFERQTENEDEHETNNNSTAANSTTNDNETLIATDPNLMAFYLYPKQEKLLPDHTMKGICMKCYKLEDVRSIDQKILRQHRNLCEHFLYSTNNSYLEELQFGNRESVAKSSYNTSNPIVFLVHGFISNYTHKFTQSVKNSYLQNGFGAKENIIAVDWGKLSTPENYKDDRPPTPQWKDPSNDVFYQAAVRNVPVAGKRIAEFIFFLVSERFLSSPSYVHMIGFSLGAHVSGVCGYVVKTQNNNNTNNNKTSYDVIQPPTPMIQRISGMDPAGPLYQNEMAVEKRLDPSHANFVDVIHTNSGQDGYYGAIGHADFHPNGGGPNQPGCQNSNVGNSIPESMTGTCAHNRAWQFYIRSITENNQACKCVGNGNVDFVLCRSMCTQKATFGRNCPSTARGNYYLEM